MRDETYHGKHNDAKGRIGGNAPHFREVIRSWKAESHSSDFILTQDHGAMKSNPRTAGHSLGMLLDGMLTPAEEHEDGTLVWEDASGKLRSPIHIDPYQGRC